MTFVPSQTIGPYEIIGIIDQPKTGVTYKVRNPATGSFELLRALPGAPGDPESVERFLREIKVHTRLCHPNIVAFYDAQQLDGQLVMTAEFVEGPKLSECLRPGPLPWREAIRQVCDLLSALEDAHSLGIVHRSITPDHIMVTPDGTVKLGGFGLAKPIADMNLTQTGAILGDPKYISPEQVSGRPAIDHRADLYSVGILLYEILTGKAPFEGRSDYDTMLAQVTAQPAAPSTLTPEISPELDRIVLTALAKDPSQRYQSAGKFREALQRAAAKGPRLVAAAAEPRSAVPRAHSKMTVMIGALSVVIGLAVIFFLAMYKL